MYRATVLFMLGASVLLFAMNRAGSPAVLQLRTHLTDAITPVLAVVSSPLDVVRGATAWVSELVALREENIRLKNENVQLLQWQAAAREMESENQALRAMLNVVPMQKRSYITARIVSDLGGPYMHAALINGGQSTGIKVDQAVVTEVGLLGRVIEAGDTSARVLLLTDINSRVPVIAEQSREKSIMVGASGALPELSYLAANSEIAVGERVVTSGDGGVFPPGVPVGVVASVDGGVVKVQPFADPSKASFVSAVDYQF